MKYWQAKSRQSILFATDEKLMELLKEHEAFLRKNILLNQVTYHTDQPLEK